MESHEVTAVSTMMQTQRNDEDDAVQFLGRHGIRKLKEYKQRHGDCRGVPRNHGPFGAVGYLNNVNIRTQSQKTMSAERKLLLERIGF